MFLGVLEEAQNVAEEQITHGSLGYSIAQQIPPEILELGSIRQPLDGSSGPVEIGT